MPHHPDDRRHTRPHADRESALAAALHALADRADGQMVALPVPLPDDYATPKSWNALADALAHALHQLNTQTQMLMIRLNDADARFQAHRDRIAASAMDLKDRLADALVLSPHHEYHLSDSFVSDRQLDPTSDVRVDSGAHVVTLRQTGFQSYLHATPTPAHRVTVAFDDETDRGVLRGVGHRYGLIAGGPGVSDVPDPEDLQVRAPDVHVVTTDSPHHAIDLEQVGFMDDRIRLALRRARHYVGSDNVDMRWPIAPLRLGHQPPLTTKLIITLDTPATVNRLTLTQQPVGGDLADLYDLAVVTETGARHVVLSGPVTLATVSVVFAPLTIVRAEWGVRQRRYQPIPIHLSHERIPGGLHLVAPV